MVHANSEAASRAFELLLQPIIYATRMVDVAALEHFNLHARFQCVKTDTARDRIVFNLFLLLFSRRRRDAACY